MRKGMMIAIIVMVIVLGSAGAYALERIDKTDGGYETYDAATQTWTLYVRGLDKPAHAQKLDTQKWEVRKTALGTRGEIKTITTPPTAPAPPQAAAKAEGPKKEQVPAQTDNKDKAGSAVTPESAKPDKLRELVVAKVGTQQDLATAQEEYRKAQAIQDKTREGYNAAAAKEDAARKAWVENPSAENMAAFQQAQRDKNTWEKSQNLARSELVEKEIKVQDADMALKQKETALAEEYAAREKGTPVEKARSRQEEYRSLLEKEQEYEDTQEKTEKEIRDLQQYISKIKGDEAQEEALEKAEARLEAKEKELAKIEEDVEKNKAEIEKQKPINSYDAANIRIAEIDREITDLTVRTTTAAEQEYKRIQNERIDAENAIKNELEAPGIKSEYEKAKVIPEKERTAEQKKVIEGYEYKLEEYTAALADWKAQETKAKAEYETKQIEAQEKAQDLNKEKAEVQDAKETFKLQKEIADLDTKIADRQKQLAGADKDAKAKLEKEIEKLERQKEEKQNELFLRETNWFARWAFIFMTDFMQGYEEYKGIGHWSSLWISDEDMAKKRQETAQKFCDEILGGVFGGKNCYQSRICEGMFPRDPPPAQNFLVTDTGVGGYIPAASIQAEKSFPAMYMEAGKAKTKRVYKITYFIENPHMDQELTYYIELRGDKTFKSEESKLAGRMLEKAGGKEGRLGSDPMIFESDNNYDNACLVFSPRIMNSNGGYANEICAPIIQYSGAATKPYTLPPATQAAAQNTTGTTTGVTMTGA